MLSCKQIRYFVTYCCDIYFLKGNYLFTKFSIELVLFLCIHIIDGLELIIALKQAHRFLVMAKIMLYLLMWSTEWSTFITYPCSFTSTIQIITVHSLKTRHLRRMVIEPSSCLQLPFSIVRIRNKIIDSSHNWWWSGPFKWYKEKLFQNKNAFQ